MASSISVLLVVLAQGEMAHSVEQFLVCHHLLHLHCITFTFSSISMPMQLSRPQEEQRHMNATFEERGLPAAIWCIDLRQAQIVRTTIVTPRNDHQSIVRFVGICQTLQHLAHTSIESANHSSIHLRSLVLAQCSHLFTAII